jgi:hypothetical protein
MQWPHQCLVVARALTAERMVRHPRRQVLVGAQRTNNERARAQLHAKRTTVIVDVTVSRNSNSRPNACVFSFRPNLRTSNFSLLFAAVRAERKYLQGGRGGRGEDEVVTQAGVLADATLHSCRTQQTLEGRA